MTIQAEPQSTLNEQLEAAWPGTRLAGDPVPLTGGFWAAMQRIEVTGQPDGVPALLVHRVAPSGPMGAKELAVQRAVAETGFPTPAVRLSGQRGTSTWSVMDFAAGSPPLAGLDGVAALRNGAGILRRLPGQLAGPLAELHALDPAPVTAAVRAAAPGVAWTVDDLLEHYATVAEPLGGSDLAVIVERVASARPVEGRAGLCHGDYHPFNLLIDDGGAAIVLDWTGALHAEPSFDLAFTTLLLENPPLHAPGPLRPVIGAVGRRLSARFLAAYRAAAPSADLSSLGWHRALHGVRILVELATMDARGDGSAARHPFGGMRAAAHDAIGQATR